MIDKFRLINYAVVEDERLSAGALHVFFVLWRRANGDGDCFPSISTIASESRLSEKTAKKHMRELQDLGFLSVRQRMNTSNWYHIDFPPDWWEVHLKYQARHAESKSGCVS